MNEKKQYNLDIEKIRVSFKIKDSSLTHSHGNELKLLPYVGNDKRLVLNFDRVIGAFSRMISNKKLNSEFNSESFIDNVIEQIGEFDGENSKLAIKDIVRSIFIKGDSLVDFDINTTNYIVSSKEEEKIASFLYSIFINDQLSLLILQKYNQRVKNVLYKLALNSLPLLEEEKYSDPNYKCYLPFIKELFINDLKFIIQDEQLYKSSLKRFLEYYFMFYVSQLCIKLNKFNKADLEEPETLYYTLDWESTSKNRIAYKFGWDLLKTQSDSLFSHAITLELLNHHGLDKQFGYVELFDIFNSTREEVILNRIEEILKVYMDSFKDIDWNSFKASNKSSQNIAFDGVYKLFEAVEYQFENSGRARASKAYENWFLKFVYENFAKRRGPLGYNLNLNEEDIILMTKICISGKKKLKLNILFKEFHKRGMSFDRDSKVRIIELYEKLNLLEKKSDSGDAQYVRSIL